MTKLTEGYVAKLKVPCGKREIQEFDDALPGFGIRKFASGKASYFVKYSIGPQQRKLSLGQVVPGALAEKRKLASEVLSRARIGQDVAADKRAAKITAANQAIKLGKLIGLYLNEREGQIRDATRKEESRYLQRYWTVLHSRAIDAIQRRDVVQVIDEIATDHGKVAADRARTALSTFFAWAIDRGYLDLNPVHNIGRRAQAVVRERVLGEAELVTVWKATDADDYGRIVRLLILTGQRRSEIGNLAWPELDAQRQQLELPSWRTKNGRPHIIPLSSEALAILTGISRIGDREYVFGMGSGGFSGWSKAKAGLVKRLPKEMPTWTLHDIRRSVVTHLNERDFAQPHVIEAIVNHVSGHRAGIAGVYNKAQYLAERRRALDLWGQHISAMVDGSLNKVVVFGGSRANG